MKYDYGDITRRVTAERVAEMLGIKVANHRCAATWRGGRNPSSVHFHDENGAGIFTDHGSEGVSGNCLQFWNYVHGFQLNDQKGLDQAAEEIASRLGIVPKEFAARPRGPDEGFGWEDALPDTEKAEQVIRAEYVVPVPLPDPGDKWRPVEDLMGYLKAVFREGEKVSVCMSSASSKDEDGVEHYHPKDSGQVFEIDDLLAKLRDQGNDGGVENVLGPYNRKSGVWVRVNPVRGDNGDDRSVTAYRHALVECDSSSPEEQLAIIREMNLPCAAVVFSGSKSIHAVVKVDADTRKEYEKRVDFLFDFCEKNQLPIDRKNRNPSRLSRLPGIVRGEGKQYLVDTDCGAADWKAWKDWYDERNDDLPDIEAADSFIDNPPPLADEIIGGVLRKGHKMLLSGPSKAGKSYLLMELAMAVAEGREWLGWKCAEGRALYINLELDASSCKNRLHDLYAAKGWKYSRGRLDIWNLRGRSEPLGKLCDKLIRRSRDKGYTIIIIDPIYKVITGDENDAASMAAFCNFFDRIAAGTGAAVAYCHHHSKGEQGMKKAQDRASGSGVFARDPDALIDMIALPLDEGRRKAVTDRLACDALYVELDRLKPNWRTIISQDDALIPSKIAEWFSKEPGFNEAFDRAMAATESATGWRIDGILREFPGFKPKDIWFRWPCHEADTTGMLKDVLSEGEENIRRRKGPTKKEKLEAMGAEFSLIFDTLAARGGDVTAQAMAEDMRVSVKEIYSMAQKLKTFVIKDSIVRRKE